MRCKIRIEFMDGSSTVVEGYRVTFDDHLLSIRTSHDTSYREDWERFPLVNIKRWSNEQ